MKEIEESIQRIKNLTKKLAHEIKEMNDEQDEIKKLNKRITRLEYALIRVYDEK